MSSWNIPYTVHETEELWVRPSTKSKSHFHVMPWDDNFSPGKKCSEEKHGLPWNSEEGKPCDGHEPFFQESWTSLRHPCWIVPPSILQNRDVHAITECLCSPTSKFLCGNPDLQRDGEVGPLRRGLENRSLKDRIIALIKETPKSFLCFLSQEDGNKLAAYNLEKALYPRLSILAFQSVWPVQIWDMDFWCASGLQAIIFY